MTTEKEIKTEKDKKLISSFKASFNQGLTKDGENVFLKITLNDSLKEYIKQYIINEIEIYSFNDTQKFKRYKVKGFIFRELTTFREVLFIKDILEEDNINLYFDSLRDLNRFKDYFKQNFKIFIEITSGLELNQDIIFKA